MTFISEFYCELISSYSEFISHNSEFVFPQASIWSVLSDSQKIIYKLMTHKLGIGVKDGSLNHLLLEAGFSLYLVVCESDYQFHTQRYRNYSLI